jgi:hypothetical protein
MKVKNPASSRKITMKTYATGEEKYALSSRFAIVQMVLALPVTRCEDFGFAWIARLSSVVAGALVMLWCFYLRPLV